MPRTPLRTLPPQPSTALGEQRVKKRRETDVLEDIRSQRARLEAATAEESNIRRRLDVLMEELVVFTATSTATHTTATCTTAATISTATLSTTQALQAEGLQMGDMQQQQQPQPQPQPQQQQ